MCQKVSMWLKYNASSYLTPRWFIVMSVCLAWPGYSACTQRSKPPTLLSESPCFCNVVSPKAASSECLCLCWWERIHPLSERVWGWTSCPLLSQLRWESLHLSEICSHCFSVSSRFTVNQNVCLSSELLKNSAVMCRFSFIFQVKIFLSCEHNAQSSQWVTEE